MAQTTGSIANGRAERQPRLWPAAAAAALLLYASFPPFGLDALAWAAPAPLFWALWRARRLRHALGLGYLFGVLFWAPLTPWIGVTVVRWALTPLGWSAWVVLTLIEAAWFALLGGLCWWMNRRTAGLWRVTSVAAAWCVVEWLRSQGPLAMPWGILGASQSGRLAVIQVADLGGVYLVSGVLVLVSAALATLADPDRRLRYRALPLAATVACASAGYGMWRLGAPAPEDPYRAAVVQPNLVSARTAPRDPARELALFERLGDEIAPASVDLVVWPESAAPTSAITEEEDAAAFARIARRTRAWQLVGTAYTGPDGGARNSAALITPHGGLAARYDKRHLVPYGEFTPARSVMPFDEVFQYQDDLVRGTSDAPLPGGDARLAVLVCYESVFPQVAAARVRAGANLVAAITNDSWAGPSAELAQHAQMTVLRAVETRRWVVVSATTGLSGFISPQGRARWLAPHRPAVAPGQAELRGDLTPYVQWGDAFVGLSVIWMGAAALLRAGTRRAVAGRTAD